MKWMPFILALILIVFIVIAIFVLIKKNKQSEAKKRVIDIEDEKLYSNLYNQVEAGHYELITKLSSISRHYPYGFAYQMKCRDDENFKTALRKSMGNPWTKILLTKQYSRENRGNEKICTDYDVYFTPDKKYKLRVTRQKRYSRD